MRTRLHRNPHGGPRRAAAAATAALCTMSAIAAPQSAASAGTGSAPTIASAPVVATTTHTVTLLTGDRIQYGDLPDGRPQVVVDPAARAGGNPVTFRTLTVRGPGGQPGLYVVPSDAERPLAAGVLDRELFNVRTLTREGLDDAGSASLPLIVSYRGGAAAGKLGTLPAVQRTRALPSVRGAALRLDRRNGSRFWSAIGAGASPAPQGAAALNRGLAKVWLDRRVRVTLDRSVPQIGAPAAWRAGYDGTGVTVGVLDTGVDADHPDLAGKVAAASDFTETGGTADGNGHGTHVAATIAGTGAASGGRFRGVAPGAKLMVGKVLDDEGFGLDSWVISGMEWAARGGAKVVSMSLAGVPTDGSDPLSEAVNSLTEETGTLFVVAAGNSGVPKSVGTPGAADAALTVGAVDGADRTAHFSSRGPRWGDGGSKPEIAAPGVAIVAARAAGTSLGDPVDDWYTSLSGTSMATPHVAGAAAILAQRHRAWRGPQLKNGLVTSAATVDGGWADTGAGRVDAARAVRQDVTGPAAVNVGQLVRADGVARRTVGYVNGGSQPVTLNLRLSATNWRGRPAPAGIARLSAGTVFVPADGSASVELIVDPAAAASAGVFGGAVVAESAAGDVQLRSLFSAYLTAETATVTVRVLDHRGQPTSSGMVSLVDAAYDPVSDDDPFASATYDVFVNGGKGTAQVRRGGVYTALTSQGWYRLDLRRADVMVSPEVHVTADTEVTLDARRGERHEVSTVGPTDTLFRATEVVRSTAGAVLGVLVAVRTDRDLAIHLTPAPVPARGHLDVYDKRTLASSGLQVTATARPGGGAPVGLSLDPRYDPYGTPAALAGDRTVALAWAGEGKPADLSGVDLRGKVALVGVRVPDGAPSPVSYAVQATTAAATATAAAGALAVMAYVDTAGAGPLPVASGSAPLLLLTREEGARLREWLVRGPVTVSLRGRPTPAAMYNLFFPHPGIPSGHQRRVVPGELVAIPSQYHADRPMAYEKNYFVFGARSRTALRESVLFRAPVAWTEFVGPADRTVVWRRWLTQKEQPPNAPAKTATLISNDVYATGDRLRPEERWFEGPIVEGEPTGLGIPTCGMCRGGPDGGLLVPAWRLGDSTDSHFVQSWPDYRSVVRLYRGATEIPPQPPTFGLPFPTFRLAPAPDTYRLVADGPAPRSPALRAVQHTTTEWTFRSARPTAPARVCPAELPGGCVHQPLIQLKYRLGLDLDNRAPAGRLFTFEVAAGAPAGAPGAGVAAGLWLWFSTDAGRSWRSATVVTAIGAGRYRVVVNHPAVGGDGGVWLKAEAWDSAGNRVRQTVRDAYRLAGPAR